MTDDLRATTPLFAGLDRAALAEIEAASSQVSFAAGEAVFRQGEPSDAIYIVVSGLLEVVAETPAGERWQLETMASGEWVGELSLVSDRPRAASAFALSAASAIRIPAEACRRLMGAESAARGQLLEAAFRRRPSHHLSAAPLFAGLDPEILREIDHQAQWVRLPGGQTLCQQGGVADAVFIVVGGSLEVSVGSSEGERLVDVLVRGASIGEMAVLAGETRSATVRAVRDSELVRIPSADFLRFLDANPRFAANLARILAGRLRHTTSVPRLSRAVSAVAIISVAPSPPPPGFVAALTAALEPLAGRSRAIGSREIDLELGKGAASVPFDEEGSGRLSHWLETQEAAHGVVVYECDPLPTAWTQRALRQADLVLLVARSDQEPAAAGSIDDRTRSRQELVLVHRENDAPTGTHRWLELRPPERHHHVREGNRADFARLARSITGHSIGVALSGGGARGFAHIGLLKALQERGIAVDSVGGTSMGSIIAAQAALGWSLAEMIERNRREISESAVIGDFTFPYIALMRGRSTVQLLRSMFGEIRIEDLLLPYFCVSTNLSRAEVVVHERGPLWLWVRASSAVPGIGPPVPCDGDLLVDGGLLNNLPVDILRQRCTGRVIASDASPSVDLTTRVATCGEMSGWAQLRRKLNPWSRAASFPNVFEIMLRTVAMSSDHSLERMKKEADLYLHPPLAGVSALDWAGIERVVEIGYRHASEKLDAWQGTSGSWQATGAKIIHA